MASSEFSNGALYRRASLGASYARASFVVEEEMDGVLYLVHPRGTRELNYLGMRIWSDLNGQMSLAQLASKLATEFSVSDTEVGNDLMEFCDSLLEEELLVSVSIGLDALEGQ